MRAFALKAFALLFVVAFSVHFLTDGRGLPAPLDGAWTLDFFFDEYVIKGSVGFVMLCLTLGGPIAFMHLWESHESSSSRALLVLVGIGATWLLVAIMVGAHNKWGP